MSLKEKVLSYIRTHNMLAPGQRVVAGLSGGADSVCLLSLLAEFFGRNTVWSCGPSMSITVSEAKRQTGTRRFQGSCAAALASLFHWRL